jgi:hypothetical protein
VGVSARGEGSDLLVTDMQPFDAPRAAQGVGEAVQTVADDAIDALNASGGENLDHLVGYGAGQGLLLTIDAAGLATIDKSGRGRIGRRPDHSAGLSVRECGC